MPSARRISRTSLLLGLGLALAGCPDDENANEKTKAERAGDKVESKTDRAGDKVEDRADKAGERIENRAEKAGDRIEKAGDRAEERLDDDKK
jgi:hypothetical protein